MGSNLSLHRRCKNPAMKEERTDSFFAHLKELSADDIIFYRAIQKNFLITIHPGAAGQSSSDFYYFEHVVIARNCMLTATPEYGKEPTSPKVYHSVPVSEAFIDGWGNKAIIKTGQPLNGCSPLISYEDKLNNRPAATRRLLLFWGS